MAVFAELHDGRRLEFPDGTDPAVVQAVVKRMLSAEQPAASPQTAPPAIQSDPNNPQNVQNVRRNTMSEIGGYLRGAGSIGATLLAPMDAFNAHMLSKRSKQNVPSMDRRADMTNALAGMGVDTESRKFQTAKTVAELAGIGGIMPTAGGGMLMQAGKGALAGGAAAGLIDPDLLTTGAGIGAAFPVVGKGVSAFANSPAGAVVGKTVRAPYRVIEPWLPGGKQQIQGRALNELAGGRQAEVLQGLDEARSFIPGSHPNAAQAAVGSGSTTFPAGANLIQSRAHTDASQALESAQEAARLAAVKRVSQSNSEGVNAAAVKAAEKVRGDAAKSNYGKAFKNLVESDPAFADIASTPSMGQAIARARKIAAEKKRPFVFGEDKPAQVVSSRLVDESGVPLSQTVIPAEQAKYPVESVHYLKMALDDMVKDPAMFGIGASEANAIMGTRGKLVKWLGDKSKPYDFARAEYARQSGPVNRLEVGGQLENALRGANAVDERAGVFQTAMRNAPQTIKKATGQSRFNALEDVLTLGEESAMRGVRADLSRNAEVNRLASAGSKEAVDILGQSFKTIEPPGLLHRGVMIARAVLERMQGKASGDILADLALVLNDPAQTAALMRNVKPQDRFAVDSLLKTLSAGKTPAAAMLAGSEQ